MIAERMDNVAESATVAFADRIRAAKASGKDILDLTVGQPDAPTPKHVVQATIDSLERGETGYGASAGLPALREAVAARQKALGIDCTPGNVLITPAKHAVLTALLSTIDPGDEVVVPTPAWVSYDPMTGICGGRFVPVPFDASDPHSLVPEVEAAVTVRTRAIVINTPCNPLGTVLPEAVLRDLVELCAGRDLLLVSDEIYDDLVFDPPFISAGRWGLGNVAIVGGVSKGYAMTGYRTGWLVGSGKLMDAALRIQQHSVTCAPIFCQNGALAALKGPQESVVQLRRAYRERAQAMARVLRAAGADVPEPGGAFYLFPKWPGRDGSELAEAFLDQAGVAVVPGEAFGPGGEGAVRISLIAPTETLVGAAERMTRVVP